MGEQFALGTGAPVGQLRRGPQQALVVTRPIRSTSSNSDSARTRHEQCLESHCVLDGVPVAALVAPGRYFGEPTEALQRLRDGQVLLRHASGSRGQTGMRVEHAASGSSSGDARPASREVTFPRHPRRLFVEKIHAHPRVIVPRPGNQLRRQTAYTSSARAPPARCTCFAS